MAMFGSQIIFIRGTTQETVMGRVHRCIQKCLLWITRMSLVRNTLQVKKKPQVARSPEESIPLYLLFDFSDFFNTPIQVFHLQNRLGARLRVDQLRVIIMGGSDRACEGVEELWELWGPRRPIGSTEIESRERRFGGRRHVPFGVDVGLVEGEQEAAVQNGADAAEGSSTMVSVSLCCSRWKRRMNVERSYG